MNGAPERRGTSVVAVVLAVGLATAVNLITFAAAYDAIFSKGPGLSENATQILTTVFGGMIGVLGSYVGFRAGTSSTTANGPADVAAAFREWEARNGPPPTPPEP